MERSPWKTLTPLYLVSSSLRTLLSPDVHNFSWLPLLSTLTNYTAFYCRAQFISRLVRCLQHSQGMFSSNTPKKSKHVQTQVRKRGALQAVTQMEQGLLSSCRSHRNLLGGPAWADKTLRTGTELQIHPVTTEKNVTCWNTRIFKVMTQDLIFQHEKKSKPFDFFGAFETNANISV